MVGIRAFGAVRGLFRAAAWNPASRRQRWCFGLLLATSSGCAMHKQVQYFAATDPETGLTNYYKMTVTGSGGFPMDYHMQAGYFSAAAVDILRGSMPKIPTLDMPIEHEQHFRALTDRYYATLLQDAKDLAPITDPEALYLRALGRVQAARKELEEAEDKKRRLTEELSATEQELAAANAEATAATEAVLIAAAAKAEAEARPGASEPERTARNQAIQAANKQLVDAQARVEIATRHRLNATAKKQNIESAIQRATLEIDRHEQFITKVTEVADALWDKHQQAASNPEVAAAEPRSPQEIEDHLKQIARLVWFGSLSDSDVISVGMTETTDPFQFRKLVFWASASNIDLNQFSTEIDGVVDSVTQLAGAFRQQAKQRAAGQQAGNQAFGSLVAMLPLTPEQKAALTGVLGMMNPQLAPPAPAASPASPAPPAAGESP